MKQVTVFDPTTAAYLRSAPSFPGLDAQGLPEAIAARYAQLAARRLGGLSSNEPEQEDWPLTRVADAYELTAVLTTEESVRKPSAFVSATAHQLLAQERREADSATPSAITREFLNPSIAAVLLFLVAEQQADAADASRLLAPGLNDGELEKRVLHYVQSLASGRLAAISENAAGELPGPNGELDLEEQATQALIGEILRGIEVLASELLSSQDGEGSSNQAAETIFQRVIDASVSPGGPALDSNLANEERPISTYAGPFHLASLLFAAAQSLTNSAAINAPSPPTADPGMWSRWLERYARTSPYVWPNHRRLVFESKFHLMGTSSVVIFPTGAGKSSLASFKIASTLASGLKVVYLAPTHALVAQLTKEFETLFSEENLRMTATDAVDIQIGGADYLGDIEVMTPERCLAMLSFPGAAFDDVGLLVFDECHLLSAESGTRRSLDATLCVLAFTKAAPDADLLMLSAMLNNGSEVADWVEELTGRHCHFDDNLWKPSRQVRGVVVYLESDLADSKARALARQATLDRSAGKLSKNLRAAAKKELHAQPYALFGLAHNWNRPTGLECSIQPLLDARVPLAGKLERSFVSITPNANEVAAQIAAASARENLKTIIFVNNKSHAIGAARKVAELLSKEVDFTDFELSQLDAISIEFGGPDHSLVSAAVAVPHNADMFKLERDLAEALFRRGDGAQVIVATPTLAQGLNLPAHLAILAGDKRSNPSDGSRSVLAAHEILNAAGRAGRAGHLANGLVLLVPEPVLGIPDTSTISQSTASKLESILPEDDRCIEMVDPLGAVLDRITTQTTYDAETQYALNRLVVVQLTDGNPADRVEVDVSRSFAAFSARKKSQQSAFDAKVDLMRAIVSGRSSSADDEIMGLSARTGIDVAILGQMRDWIRGIEQDSFDSVVGLTDAVMGWLAANPDFASALFSVEDQIAIARCTGRPQGEGITRESLDLLRVALDGWLNGESLFAIEQTLTPNGTAEPTCPRVRTLALRLLPRTLSFIFSVIAGIAALDRDDLTASRRLVLESLSTAVRLGFESPAQVAVARVARLSHRRRYCHLELDSTVREVSKVDVEDFAGLMAVAELILHLKR